MNADLIEEMKAKITANCGMALTADETKEVLAALTSPETVQESALGVSTVAASIVPSDAERAIMEAAHSVEFAPMIAEETEEESEEPKPEQKGPLPDDFPGRAALAGAGINTFAQLHKARDSKEGLTGLTGVGEATATKIEEALK